MEQGSSHKGPSAISLRPFQLADVDDVMEWMSDAAVGRYTEWETVATREEALEYMKATILPHPWYRAICLNGKPVGYVSVEPWSGLWRCRAEVRAGIARKFWGRGIVTAALRMAAAAAFSEWPHLARLDGLVDVENRASLRMIEKTGFIREVVHTKFYWNKEGRAQDVARYYLLRVDSKL